MRTAVVTVDGDDAHVLAGLTDLVVLKTTGSEFWGFPRDRYTTLAETRDRILATAVTARWRYTGTDARTSTPPTPASGRRCWRPSPSTHSLALQQSLYAMGEAVLERFPDVAEIRMSMPNKHHFLQDLSAFGLDNPGRRVYHADDRPYGLIEGTVLRDDVAAGRGRLAGHARLLLSRSAGLDADAAEQHGGVDPQVGGVLVVGALRPRRRRRCRRRRGTATRPASPAARGPPARPSARGR